MNMKEVIKIDMIIFDLQRQQETFEIQDQIKELKLKQRELLK